MRYLFKNNFRAAGAAGLIVLMTLAFACKDVASYNDNPNQPNNAKVPYLVTGAQKNLADNYWGNFQLGYFGNLYAQYWAETQYPEESQYQYRPTQPGNFWDGFYLPLNSLQQIIRQGQNEPDVSAAYGNVGNQIAAAKIMKAWTYETLTDVFGAIPYQQALQGADNPTPSYNSQEEIYAALIDTLANASSSLNTDERVFTSGDILLGGDAVKWKKFANSLIMRLAIREADAKPQEAAAAFQQAYQSGGIEDGSDNVLFGYQTADPNDNPQVQAEKTRDDFAVTNTLIDFMNSNNDPRRSSYAQQNPVNSDETDTYIGFPYGLASGPASTYYQESPWSRPSDRVLADPTAPAIFMTASETLFNEAEAAQRGWISADPAAKYAAAIQASMSFWGVSEADASTYIANNPYNAGNWRQNLGRQKWVALYMQGVQGWSVFRRLDFGLFNDPVGGKLMDFATQFPVRYPYPTNENQLNGANVDSALSVQGFDADDQGQLLWWDAAAEGK